MNELQKDIITLIRCAITGEAATLQEDFRLEQALSVARRHGILPLIYEGALRCGVSEKDSVMRQIFATYCKAVMVSERQERELIRIRDVFNREKIDYMLLKGSKMKALYPKPELRQMGDADILIKITQYDRIKPLMESLGFEEKQDTDHEYVWKSKGLYLELHKRLIPSYNKDFYAYYGDGWNLAAYCDGSSWSMRTEDEWIYLFTHFAKHYRDGGIGLRHVTDLWIWRKTYPKMDEDYICGVMKKLQLDVFYGHMLCLLSWWFENGEADEILEVITEFVFSSGSFGVDEMRTLSQAVRNIKYSKRGVDARLQYLWKNAFPNVQILKEKYTILQKAPWMLPAVWMVRPIYKTIFEWHSLERKKRNLKVLSAENVDLRHELLNIVGLDYHF